MSDIIDYNWKPGWKELPILDKECLVIVNGEYKLAHIHTEQDDWESGGATYDIWVESDGYGDVIEYDDISMWKYLEEKPKVIPMPYENFKLMYGTPSDTSPSKFKVYTEEEIKTDYTEYLMGFK